MGADQTPRHAPAEISADVSRLLLEALVGLLRQQDSDLRMLALVEAQAEEADARTTRLVEELAAQHPGARETNLRRLVDETTDLYFERVAKADDLESVVESVLEMAHTYDGELPHGTDGATLAATVLSACADVSDSTRMYATLLMGAMASFEGTLLRLVQVLAAADPTAARTKGRERQGFGAAVVTLREHEHLFEAIYTATRSARGGWRGWQRLFGWFGFALPEASPLLEEASRVRNAVAHTNGLVAHPEDGAHSDSDVRLDSAAEITPEFLRDVLDAQLTAAAALGVTILNRAFGDAELSSSYVLGRLDYELLVRRRDSVIAGAQDLHDQAISKDVDEERHLQVNFWLALHRLGRQGKYMRELSRWGPEVDGTVLDAARAILLSRPGKAKRIAQRLRTVGALGEREWLTWPLIDEIRG
ncbi:hypothetical protein [Demequina aestuarii]|uniref:hypothetical protein n=1 Tax=Demequina aestuarii TaxID=327095 RepID=UPI0007840DA6|nr:hypothetical protein [Demequina aestuarii]